MGCVCWDFPLLGTGNQTGGDVAAKKLFQGVEIMDSLAREVCQNSLDARNTEIDTDEPVIVKFRLIKIRKNEYSSFFDAYSKVIDNSIDYWNASALKTEKVMDFLCRLKKSLARDEISILVMSDYNTTGLSGVKATLRENSFWNLLVNSEGISIKQNENSLGSFGVGKYAPFSYSSLSAVAYNTLATDGGRAFQCVSRIVTSTRSFGNQEVPTQSVGKYLYLDNQVNWRPIYPEDGDTFANMKIFQRNQNEFGTDVAIIGFDYDNWEDELAAAVLKNFLVGIMHNKLQVIVQSEDNVVYDIDSSTYEELLMNTLGNIDSLKITRQNYRVLTQADVSENVRIADQGDLSIYMKYDPEFESIIARFRESGMFINTVKFRGQHCGVVTIVNDVGKKTLSTILRDAEPPAHNEWSKKYIDSQDTKKRNKYSNLITAINREINRLHDKIDSKPVGEVIDAGTNKYLSFLPDDENADSDEQKGFFDRDTKIISIKTNDGRVLYTGASLPANTGEGQDSLFAHRNGPRKKKKRASEKKIPAVDSEGQNKGATKGEGKLRMKVLNIYEHRTFSLGGNKYRLVINVEKDYDNIEINYKAILENGTEETVGIVNCKDNEGNLIDTENNTMKAVKLKQGNNFFTIEFANNEIMAVKPEFKMEITK